MINPVSLSLSLREDRKASQGELTRGGSFCIATKSYDTSPPQRLVPRLRPSQREGKTFLYRPTNGLHDPR